MGRHVIVALSALALTGMLGQADASLSRRRRHAAAPFGLDGLFGNSVFDHSAFHNSVHNNNHNNNLFGNTLSSAGFFPQLSQSGGFPTAAWLPGSSGGSATTKKRAQKQNPFAALMDVFGSNLVTKPASTASASATATSSSNTGAVAQPSREVQLATPPPARTYNAHTDDATGDLVIEVSAPQASGTSFDIEVDDAKRTVRIKELWKRSESHALAGGGRSSSKSSGMFEKKWRVPATVVMDSITAEWDDEASQLVIRMPVDDTQNLLIEHDSDGSKSAVAAQDATAAGQCSDEQRAKQQSQQEAYERRMQEEYRKRLRKYEEQRAAYEKQQKAREAQERAEYERRLKEYDRKKREYQQRQQELRKEEEEKRKEREELVRRHNELRQQRRQQMAEWRAEYERQQAQLQAQEQEEEVKVQKEPAQQQCGVGSQVQAVYAPNGQFYDAVIQAINEDSGRLLVAWYDGDTSNVVLPARQEYIRGCELVSKAGAPSASSSSSSSSSRQPAAASAPASTPSGRTTRKIVTDEQRQQGSLPGSGLDTDTPSATDDDEFEIIEEWFTDEDFAAQEKDDDASDGYYMFGEFHPY